MMLLARTGTRKFVAFCVTVAVLLVFVTGCIWARADAEMARIGVYGFLGALGLFVGANAAEHLAGMRAPLTPSNP